MRTTSFISLLAAIAASLAACDGGGKEPTPPPPPRFEAVAAAKPVADPLAELCDVKHDKGAGPVLALPLLEKPPAEGAAANGPQWINLWATWCKPCVEELPMIERWKQKLAADGTAVPVHFVSVDATPQLVEDFRAQHPGLPATERIADPAALTAYAQTLGLDATAGLPIHAFAGPDGKLRCVRSGAVLDSHYETIASIFR